MKKKIPLREQVSRAVLDNPNHCANALISTCYCHNNGILDECDRCEIKFYCYTNFTVNRKPL